MLIEQTLEKKFSLLESFKFDRSKETLEINGEKIDGSHIDKLRLEFNGEKSPVWYFSFHRSCTSGTPIGKAETEKSPEDEFTELIKPIYEWLKKYHDPHTTIEISTVGAKVMKGVLCFPNT